MAGWVGRLRDDVEEARGAAEALRPRRPSAVAVALPVAGFAGFAKGGSRMTRTSLNASLSRRERDARNPLDQRGTLTARTPRAKRHARDASDSRCPLAWAKRAKDARLATLATVTESAYTAAARTRGVMIGCTRRIQRRRESGKHLARRKM